MLPAGRAKDIANGLAVDFAKVAAALRNVVPASAEAKTVPSPIVRIASAAMLALAIGAAGCAGALPVVAEIVIDAGCVAAHYDELAVAERAGLAPFAVAVEKVARACGIEQQLVVTIFGTHKSEAARASQSAPCSSDAGSEGGK